MKKVVISCVGLLAMLTSVAIAQTDKAKESTSKEEPVVVTLTTVTFAESTGCWARIHDGGDYTGRTLTLMGEQSLPHLEFGIGYDWEGDIDSVEVGPKARLILYEDERYGDRKRELKPNERVADLHKSIFDEGVESMKLTCVAK